MPSPNLRSQTRAVIAMLCAAALVSCGSAPPALTAIHTPVVPYELASDCDHLLQMINLQRTKQKLPKLVVDQRLAFAARDHSSSMEEHDYFAHKGKDGRRFPQRMARYGYPHSHSAENIAMAFSASSVFNLWFASKGHRSNMMERKFSRVGIARAGNYWTAVFAAPDGT